MIFLLIHLTFSSFALSFLPSKEANSKIHKNQRTESKRPKHKASFDSESLETLKKENEALKKLVDLKFQNPTIITEQSIFRPGEIINGELALSVLSSNLLAPIKITLKNSSLPKNSYALCSGATGNNRIQGTCSKIITPTNEYDISATILNSDGSAGLVGEIYSGKEEYIAGIIATSAASAMLSVSQDSVATTAGNLIKDTKSNKLKSAGIVSAEEINSLLKEEMTSKTPKVFAIKGTSALLFIHDMKSKTDSKNKSL